MNFIDENTKKISVTITEDRRKQMNRVAELLNLDPDDWSTTDFFDKAMQTVENKSKPKGSLPADLEKIAKLEENYNELLSKYDSKVDEIVELKAKIDQDSERMTADNQAEKASFEMRLAAEKENYQKLKETSDELRMALTESESIRSELELLLKNQEIASNQLLLTLTPVQLEYLETSVKSKRIVQSIREMNNNGKLERIIPSFTSNEKENQGNLLLAWFFYCAKLDKFPLIPFDKWYEGNYKPKITSKK